MPSVWIERRRTGRGEIRHRVRYQLGGHGSRCHYAGSFKRRREAEIRRNVVAGELAALRVPDLTILREPEPEPTFAEAAKRWQASRVDVAEATTVQHRTALNRALPILGELRLNEISSRGIEDLVYVLHGEGKARESIRKTRTAVAMVLDHEGVSPNPARDPSVKLPREEAEEPSPPTAAHIEAILRLLPSKHRLPLLFLDWSGSRLTAAIDKPLVIDYDEQRKRVRLRRSTTKTRKPLWIELHPALAEALEASLGPREDRDPGARLFPDSGGDALRTAIAKACKAAGVPLWSPHDLRHRRVSLLHLRGVPWARIGEWVGQKNLAVTANTYTHVLTDERELDYAELLT